MSKPLALLFLAIFLTSPAIHAHGNWQQEVTEFLERRGTTENCVNRDAAETQALHQRAANRRAARLQELRDQLGITSDHVLRRRQSTSAYWSNLVAASHKATSAYNLTTAASTLFASTGGTCVLNPETTQGPYYILGEYFRNDMRETQQGVPLYMDIQVLDIDTCKPVANAYVDLWHCNSTGVYSGVVAQNNGNSGDSSNGYNSFLRGVVQTNADGVLNMTTIFPGHYTGRATHIHVTTRIGGTVAQNGTYQGGTLAHVGQVFFDEALITQVEALAPYSTNKQQRTTNANDNVGPTAANAVFDPFMEYVMIGSSVSDGILAWITLTVQDSASYQYSPAGYLKTTAGVSGSSGTTAGSSASTSTATKGSSAAGNSRKVSISTTGLILATVWVPVYLGAWRLLT